MHAHTQNTLVVIPAFQEERFIAPIVERILRHIPQILVVDDGSPDETGVRAAAAGATVLTHLKNSGKGEALKTGLRCALDHHWEYVLLMDGDGQHLPEEIPAFLQASSGEVILLGNRMGDVKAMPRVRWLTNAGMYSYTYNGDGLRMTKSHFLSVTQYTWDIGAEASLPLLL